MHLRKRTDVVHSPSRCVSVECEGVFVMGVQVDGIDATPREIEAAAATFAQYKIGKAGKYTASVDWRL
jgi:hypothetical protein